MQYSQSVYCLLSVLRLYRGDTEAFSQNVTAANWTFRKNLSGILPPYKNKGLT